MRTLAALVFPGFQNLDLFGPLEIRGDSSGDIKITVVAETFEPVAGASMRHSWTTMRSKRGSWKPPDMWRF